MIGEEMDSLVSVAMATYNGEKYLEEQLDSILNQTYKNIEVIICDDCSTDKNMLTLRYYIKNYNIQYFDHNPILKIFRI